jgi:hypothetical protein
LLDARDQSSGTETWSNAGTLGGPFRRIGSPTVRAVEGQRAVFFDGLKDAYAGPPSVSSIEGAASRSIEVWAYIPGPVHDEGPLVAWGKRGGPPGANMCFGIGRNASYGAAGHWATDMGWNGVLATGKWHYLVYTYDGTTARIYDNTAAKNVLPVRLRTASGNHVNVGVQNSAQGELAFINEFTGSPMGTPVGIAMVRVTAGALTEAQILRDFKADAARFHAVALKSSRDLFLKSGTTRLTTPALTLQVFTATQEALSLSPSGTSFDFLPSDRQELRSDDRFYQLGDIDFRVRSAGAAWRSYSTAERHARVRPISLSGGLAADLSPTLPADCPLQVERRWVPVGDGLAMRFVVRNKTARPVEIGAFGAAMVHNNLLTNRSLDETHERCSFADPYIGGDAGYLQVTRLNGKGPTLLILPEKGTGFEAYRPLHDDPTPRNVTFEGFYEWTVHSRAYAENEWKKAEGWNAPTSRVLGPGESVTYGWRFLLAPGGSRQIEPTLIARKRPVAVGIPGYIVPTDQTAKLFLHAPIAVSSVRVEPAGMLRVLPTALTTANGWKEYAVAGLKPGRCRLALTYADGTRQFVHYFVTLPAATQIANLGRFHATKQWFTDPADPFGRTYSYLPFDRRTGSLVTQYDPTWMVGLSDEMGAGPNLLMAMKNLAQPDATQVKQLERYVDNALWGHLQGPDYGIRASLFFYDPKALPDFAYTVRGGWNKARTETTWRSFNYPHQAAVYWCLYRLARDHAGLVTAHPWDWYLRQAQKTAMAMGTHAGPPPGGLQQFGQMVGDVYLNILDDCRREGLTAEADELERYEKVRAEHFRSLKYPYGSEMPWDSTGQEEVYTLCRRFGFQDKAQQTVEAVLAYDPLVPNWGYNGTARRYFDEAVNGTAFPDIMRLLHHYGGAQNAIPLLGAYRDHPDDFHLLRVGYAGTMGALTDIDPEGFGSQCFDADPAILAFDPLVGDYGVEFYGFACNSGAYLVRHPEFGWLGFGANVSVQGNTVALTPCDAFRNRIYLAPLGLYLALDAGTFTRATMDTGRREVTLTLAPTDANTPDALLKVEASWEARDGASYVPTSALPQSRGRYVIKLSDRPTTITLRAVPR